MPMTSLIHQPADWTPPHTQARSGILRRAAVLPSTAGEVPSLVHDVLRTPGQDLDDSTRASLGPRLGSDLSHVRVHADPRAAESARSVDALAYTVGRDIVFGAGQYAPYTSAGKKLLAHELTHVVQQQGMDQSGPLRMGDPHDAAEQAAEQVAAGGGVSRQPGQGQAVLRRQPAPQGGFVLGGSGDANDPLSRFGAGMAGSETIDGFALGKAELTAGHKKALAQHAERLLRLLKDYPDSFITVVGHTDEVGAEERNKELGQERADAALAELTANGVPAEAMRASSLGETSLLVKTGQAEPRNRRVEIRLTPRNFFRRGFEMKPTPNLRDYTRFNFPGRPPIFPGGPEPKPEPPNYFKEIPPTRPGSDPLDDALDRDPILRALPGFLRDPIKGALKRGDETLAEKAIDTANIGGSEKDAIKAAVKALLRTLRGEKWKPPIPPAYELPPSSAPEFPKAPGETMLPPFSMEWDFPYKKRK